MKSWANVLLIAFAFISTGLSAQKQIENATLSFTSIEVPGADVTDVYDINSAGDMVGDYLIGNQAFGSFLLSRGNFTLFQYHDDSTNAFGVNDSGLIVGAIGVDGQGGFIYDGTTFTIINAPDRPYTVAARINNSGLIGGNSGVLNKTSPFEYGDAKFRDIFPPGAFHAVLTGLNDHGAVVGYTDPGTPFSRSFEYVNGEYKIIRVPGALITIAEDINDSGMIVGWYLGPRSLASSFAFLNGKYLRINFPGATQTVAWGVNNLGQIVGSYAAQKNGWQGFVTTPLTTAEF